MIKLLEGKVAAITGAATGIGLSIAQAYLRHGAHVCINFLDSKQQHDAALTLRSSLSSLHIPENNLIFAPGDISKLETSERIISGCVSAWGRLDIFVSNAGICDFADFLSVTPDLLTTTLDVNLKGAYLAVQAAARQMALNQSPPGGSIIGISSISALVGGAQQTHYTPTKAGVLSLMQSTACALGKYGVRCNALLPGTIETQLNEEDLARNGGEKRRYMEGRIPLGRVGKTEDMAGPAVFLACDELSGYVVSRCEPGRIFFREAADENVQTGAQLLVDGGLFVNLQ